MLRHINMDGTFNIQLGADGPFYDIPEDRLIEISEDDFWESKYAS